VEVRADAEAARVLDDDPAAELQADVGGDGEVLQDGLGVLQVGEQIAGEGLDRVEVLEERVAGDLEELLAVVGDRGGVGGFLPLLRVGCSAG
jgi:hypothetical protein